MNLRSLLPILSCVECKAGIITLSGGVLQCDGCRSAWEEHNGIYDLRPRISLPLPKTYDDPDYREWMRGLADSQDFYYQSSRIVRWVQQAGHRAIRRLCRSRPGCLTLDLACGDGAHRPFMDSADRVVGLDVDQASLEKLRRRYPDYIVLRGDCYNMPFRDSSFDRILNIYNLEHLLHLDFALEEISRVLRSDGELMVSVPTEGGFAWRAGRRLTSARHFTRHGFSYRRANEIDHCNCIWQIEKVIRRHFRVETQFAFPLVVPFYHVNLIVTWKLRKRLA